MNNNPSFNPLKNMRNFWLFFLSSAVLMALFLFTLNINLKIDFSNFLHAQTSPDALGLRVVPNPAGLSAARWYKEHINSKSNPQSMKVDGYRAVRDGRTVYVNAANISGGKLYTNIYLISYSQSAEKATENIFSELLSHWKFNNDLMDEASELGYCMLSNKACRTKSDCSSDYKCNDTTNNCELESSTRRCYTDAECPKNLFCSSPKAKVARDVRRWEDRNDIKAALDSYRTTHSTYPTLAAGSYLKSRSISAWPSWTITLGKELGITMPADPINRLGKCKDDTYALETCWNEKTKSFGINDLSGSNSHIYHYESLENGKRYKLCLYMESGYYSGSPEDCSSKKVSGQPPTIQCGKLEGDFDEEFKGEIYVISPDGSAIDWNDINTGGTTWTDWSNAPVPENSNPPTSENRSVMKLKANKAGRNGQYKFTVNAVSNASGSSQAQECTIYIGNKPPAITENCAKVIDADQDYSCTVNFNDSNGIKEDKVSGLPEGLTFSISADKKSVTISGKTSKIGVFNIIISSEDEKGAKSQKIFELRVNSFCGDGAVQKPNTKGNGGVNESGLEQCDGTTGVAKKPADSSEEKQYGCKNCVFTEGWCGDGTKQEKYGEECDWADESVQGEGTKTNPWACNGKCKWGGGYCGDGIINGPEHCDGTAGIAKTPEESSKTVQYGCTPKNAGVSEKCRATGGYCGDGIIQKDHDEECEGTKGAGTGEKDQYSCNPKTCKSYGGWLGDNAKNGPEKCDGTDLGGINCADFGKDRCGKLTCKSDGTFDTSQCPETRCGNGIWDRTPNCEEGCDPGIKDANTRREILKKVDNKFANTSEYPDSTIHAIYESSCEKNCYLAQGCLFSDAAKLVNKGCYIDKHGTQKIENDECQKGKWTCKDGEIKCYDVFTDSNYISDYKLSKGQPVYDECCRYLNSDPEYPGGYSFSGKVTAIYPGTDWSCLSDDCDGYPDPTNGISSQYLTKSDLTGSARYVPDTTGYYPNPAYGFNCDEVCSKRNNSICIGVGLQPDMPGSSGSLSCQRVTCDSGAICSNSGNLTSTTCKTDFEYWYDYTCYVPGGHTFPVYSTACFCLAP